MITVLRIEGMRTRHCASAVYTALASVPGILSATMERGGAVIEHDGGVSAAALEQAVQLAGYRLVSVVDQRRHLHVRGPDEPEG